MIDLSRPASLPPQPVSVAIPFAGRTPPMTGQLAWDILMNEVPVCISVFDAVGRCQIANPVFERALGVVSGGLSGRTLDGLIARGAMQQFRRQLAWVIDQRSTLTAIAVVRGVCWKITLKPLTSGQPPAANTRPSAPVIDQTPESSGEPPLDNSAHQQIDSLARPASSPICSVLCIGIRLAHAAASEARLAFPPSSLSGPANAGSGGGVHPSTDTPVEQLPIVSMPDLGPLAKLTPRELQVLRLVGLGMTIAEMARRVHRAEKTLEWHRNALGTKLAIRNRVELARMAIEHGFTSLSDPQMEALITLIEREEQVVPH